MTVSEKVAYLRGLAEGLELDENNKQDKLIKAIIDVLDDMALTVADLEDTCAEMSEQIDAVDEDLSSVEDLIYEDEDDDCDCDCDCDCGCHEDECYEVECPECNSIICLEPEDFDEDIVCPNCGNKLNLDFDGCDCDCGCCDNEEE